LIGRNVIVKLMRNKFLNTMQINWSENSLSLKEKLTKSRNDIIQL